MRTGVFRGGCLTGPGHAGAELHGFLAWLMKCVRDETHYVVHGHDGKQVRDNIHADDLVACFEAFVDAPALVRAHNSGAGLYSADGSPVHSHEAPAVVSEMQRLGIRYAYANYWVAAPLQFTAGPDPVVAPLDAGTATGHTLAVVARAASPAIVAAAGPNAIATEDTLRRGQHTFTRRSVGHFVIFSDITPPWRPAGEMPPAQ
jgi:hypothetical protein